MTQLRMCTGRPASEKAPSASSGRMVTDDVPRRRSAYRLTYERTCELNLGRELNWMSIFELYNHRETA
jgi:hypothetical protein